MVSATKTPLTTAFPVAALELTVIALVDIAAANSFILSLK
jgi:hypothetical protein